MKKQLLMLGTCALLFSCANKTESQSVNTETAAVETILSSTTSTTNENSQIDNQQTDKMVKITTSYGSMVVKLYKETPQHRDNFIKLAKEGYFTDLLFHRVIQDFMIQGGDPNSKNAPAGKQLGSGGPNYTIPAEFRSNLFHKKGALSAARQADQVNPTKASSGSQFYVVQGKVATDAELTSMERQMGITFSEEARKAYKEIGGTPFLDNNYTVFGEVIEGLDVIDAIAKVKVDNGDRPLEDIKMTVTVIEDEQ